LDLKDIQFIKRGSNMHIEFPYLNILSNNLVSWQQKIKSYNNCKYLEVITKFYKNHYQLFDQLVRFVGFIDLNCTIAKLSIENIYTKPEIIQSEKSFFDAKDIRHPIVEKVQTEIEYIPNDISALSIVSAGLKTLSDIRCSFIFTSHLHQIMDIPMVKNINSLEIYHLKIKYDKDKDLLIYERKLEKGSGPAIYGLEVCKAMDLGSEFISLARSVQIEITDLNQTLLNDKQSNYNADIMMDKCQICLKPSEHTHHIKEQHEADQNNNIDHHHKNINHNLVPLCESCHYKVHNENLRIYGYHMTNNGIQLNYEYIELKKEINTKKKFNKKQIQIILGYQNDIQDKKIKKTHLMKKLELDHNIQISLGTLNKIMNNEY
jgi:hypothetical protein